MNITKVDLRTTPEKREHNKWVHSIRRAAKSVSKIATVKIDEHRYRDTDSIRQSENISYSSKPTFYLSLAWRTKYI